MVVVDLTVEWPGGRGWQDKDYSGFSLGEYKKISLNFNPKDIPFKSDSYPPLLVPLFESVILENNIAFWGQLSVVTFPLLDGLGCLVILTGDFIYENPL